MEIFPYWSAASCHATTANGQDVALTQWGWSQLSFDQANRHARQRLEALRARVATTQKWPTDRSGWDRAYYDKTPQREQILYTWSTSGERASADREAWSPLHIGAGGLLGALTRNRYGAVVLSAADMLIADIDLMTEQEAVPVRTLSGFRKKQKIAHWEAVVQSTLGRIQYFAASHPTWTVIAYETYKGMRVLIPGVSVAPDSTEASTLLERLGSDQLYIRLCAVYQSYRARLTPKPWRVGLPVPPSRWPAHDPNYPAADAQAVASFEQWQEHYQRAIAQFSTVHRLHTFGPLPEGPHAALVEEHDRITQAISGMPLA